MVVNKKQEQDCHIVVCVVQFSAQGETMRIFFSFIIAVLLTVFAEGVSYARMTGEPCHEQEQALVEDVEKCVCCSLASMYMPGHGASVDRIAGAGCCPSQTCKKSVFLKDVACSVSASPTVSGGKMLTQFPVQQIPLRTHRVVSNGLPPPRWPSAPVYIQNCSYLI